MFFLSEDTQDSLLLLLLWPANVHSPLFNSRVKTAIHADEGITILIL